MNKSRFYNERLRAMNSINGMVNAYGMLAEQNAILAQQNDRLRLALTKILTSNTASVPDHILQLALEMLTDD